MNRLIQALNDLPEHFVWLAAVFFFVVISGYVGNGDYEEKRLQQEMYCDMVVSGKWPDYEPERHCED